MRLSLQGRIAVIAKGMIIAGLALLAAPATAQQNTQCTTTFGITNCTTTGQPTSGGINWGLVDPNAFQRGWDDAQKRQQQQQQAIQQQQQIAAQRQQTLLMNQHTEQARAQGQQFAAEQASAKALGVQAGHMVAAGDCVGAQKLALDAGDFELANAVKGYCAK